MVFAILEDAESESVMRAMHDAGHPLTLIDSTGGLLRRGSSTVIAGVDAGAGEGVPHTAVLLGDDRSGATAEGDVLELGTGVGEPHPGQLGDAVGDAT